LVSLKFLRPWIIPYFRQQTLAGLDNFCFSLS
jgi:hypothetical protein